MNYSKKNISFLFLMYLLLLLCIYISEVRGWRSISGVILTYSLGLYYCYCFIFKKTIHYAYGVVRLESKYSRLFFLIVGMYCIFFVLDSLLFNPVMFDEEELKRVLKI
ncbi:hypothetical protein OA79_04335 [Marinomonas sp. TW1]|nr:hypothetical protein OA79_04335 [Marinomonas sp. TW1]